MTTAPTAAPTTQPITRAVLPRRTPWPYAGLVSGLASAASAPFLAQGQGTFDSNDIPSTQSIVAELNPEIVVRLGATIGLLGLAATLVFLLGLARFAARSAGHRPGLVEALRWSSIAMLGAGTLGVLWRYVAASGVPGSIDQGLYTPEASATAAVLADQISTGAFLPGLAVMAVVGLLAVRDRVFARPVGVVALMLAAVSLAATVGLGLPYSSSLVWILFALVVGGAGIASRRSI